MQLSRDPPQAPEYKATLPTSSREVAAGLQEDSGVPCPKEPHSRPPISSRSPLESPVGQPPPGPVPSQEPPRPGPVTFPPTVVGSPPSVAHRRSRARDLHTKFWVKNLHFKPTLPGPICHLYMLVARAALFLTGVIGIFCFPTFFLDLFPLHFPSTLYPSALA